MTSLWIGLLNFFSNLEFRIADRLGEAPAILFHFLLFWILPVVFLYLPVRFFSLVGIGLAVFYIFILIGDIFFSVFGHEKLEKKRGMIDITSVQEIKQEIIGALVKYFGGVISFATIFNGLQIFLKGQAFAVPNASPTPLLRPVLLQRGHHRHGRLRRYPAQPLGVAGLHHHRDHFRPGVRSAAVHYAHLGLH